METPTQSSWIVISDAHVSDAHGNCDAFFDMLAALERMSINIVFLGDIFELWVGIPRYESSLQQRFLEWCRRRKQHVEVGFIEGNHEFYVHHYHAKDFSWSSESSYSLDSCLLVHGDLANSRDKPYLLLRRATKNPITRTVIRWMPWGPDFVSFAKRKLDRGERPYKMDFPEAEIKGYAEQLSNGQADLVFMGHFHRCYEAQVAAGRVLVLPDWWSTQEIGRFDSRSGNYQVAHWRELLLGADFRPT